LQERGEEDYNCSPLPHGWCSLAKKEKRTTIVVLFPSLAKKEKRTTIVVLFLYLKIIAK
jgi:hypothetical protein